MLGERKAALHYTEKALAVAPKDPGALFNAAKTESQLGEPLTALEYLEKALAPGYSKYYAKDDPVFEGLRNNVEFQRLVEER